MRAIYLNCWYGQTGQPLLDFFQNTAASTHLYGLSEVSPSLLNHLRRLLPNFKYIYIRGHRDKTNHQIYGMVVFFHPTLTLISQQTLSPFIPTPTNQGYLQILRLRHRQNQLLFANVHGKALPGHKNDTPARLHQSRLLLDHLTPNHLPTLIGGDFNLNPQTRSIQLIEQAGYHNLITKYHIPTTRNKLAWQPYPPNKRQLFADYLFISPDILIDNFHVPSLLISDHLPLILDFRLP